VRAIADRAGVAIGTVSTVQHGLGNPSLATLRRIDRAVKELDDRRQECEQRIRK
jgi:DNA-binding LacI/PurR family transcriptional regulator